MLPIAKVSSQVVLNWEGLRPPADIWQDLDIFLVVRAGRAGLGGGGELLASSGQKPGILLNIYKARDTEIIVG